MFAMTEGLTCQVQGCSSWLWWLWSAEWCECRETQQYCHNSLSSML